MSEKNKNIEIINNKQLEVNENDLELNTINNQSINSFTRN